MVNINKLLRTLSSGIKKTFCTKLSDDIGNHSFNLNLLFDVFTWQEKSLILVTKSFFTVNLILKTFTTGNLGKIGLQPKLYILKYIYIDKTRKGGTGGT